jgi:23S rRNA maturation mini-RNase III
MQWLLQKKGGINGKNEKNIQKKNEIDDITDSLQASAFEALYGLLFIRIKE